MRHQLVACPHCAAHLFAHAPQCPNCGAKQESSVKTVRRSTLGALLMGLAVAGCDGMDDSGDGSVALYGVAITDNDNDGWGVNDGDCDDENADINPDAEETPGDGVDSNCDGDDNT